MFSCDKFTTGFDCENLEFGINFKLTETGYITVQKLGRYTRKKEHQDTAFLFQFTDKLDELEIIKCLQRNFEGLGILLKEFELYVKFKEKTDDGNQPPAEIRRMHIFDIQNFDMTIDVMRNLLDFCLSSENNDVKIKRLVRKYNDNINGSGDLLENLHANRFILDKKGIEEFLTNYRLSQYIDEVKYSIDSVFNDDLRRKLRGVLYDLDKCKKTVKQLIKLDRRVKYDRFNTQNMINDLVKIDVKFPHKNTWTEFYKADNSDIFKDTEPTVNNYDDLL